MTYETVNRKADTLARLADQVAGHHYYLTRSIKDLRECQERGLTDNAVVCIHQIEAGLRRLKDEIGAEV